MSGVTRPPLVTFGALGRGRSGRLLAGLLLAGALLGVRPSPLAAEPPVNRIPWQAYGGPAFAQAQAESRILLVVVSTSWCHWCRVMQRETYADLRVEREIRAAFLPIKADADARPDLAERFRQYRWPATAFLTAAGEPILALRGYRSADELLAILADVRARVRAGGPYPGFEGPPAPTTVPVAPGSERPALESLRTRLVRQLDAEYDATHQGWGRGQKYPLAEPILWGLRRARTAREDALALRRALDSLAAQEALVDRVWGGMFQYSVGPAWDDPHYEKLVEVNAGALEALAQAWALSANERWRRDGALVAGWFERFHDAPGGVFYASQDAEVGGREASRYYRLDEAGRRRLGVPRMDASVYARENGLAIRAFAAWGRLSGVAPALARAGRAADAVLASHGDASGLLRHAAGRGDGRCFLADQVEMGRALLALHQATGEARFAAAALRLADALVARLAHPAGGFVEATPEPGALGALAQPLRTLEGNAGAARLLLGVAALHDRDDLRRAGVGAILAVSDPAFVDGHWRYVGGLLLAAEEALALPRRVTLHGAPSAAGVLALRAVAERAARTDPDLWILTAEAPAAAAPFAVVCGRDGACSDPLTDPALLALALGRP